jgi:hypothetical protein
MLLRGAECQIRNKTKHRFQEITVNKLVILAAGLALLLGAPTATLAAANLEGPILIGTDTPPCDCLPDKDPTPKVPTPKGDPSPDEHKVPVSIPDRTPTPSPEIDNACADELGFLHMVRKQQVQAVMNEKVVIMPVCEGTGDVGSLFMDGNVGGLRKTIGLNETLAAELIQEDFATQDVVGIRFGKNTVVLYVHKR